MTVLTERRTEPVPPAARADRSPGSAFRRLVTRHAEGLAVLAVLAVSLASAAWFTRSFYYFQDDFVFIRQAQTSRLSLTYLRGSLFQHFSPVSRLLDYALAHWFDSRVAAAHTIELVLLAASVLAFSWTITELVGHRWWRHLLTLAFAESLALLHLLGWWTATANVLPATLLGLLTIGAFLRYRRVGTRWWVAISLLSYGLSLCAHEQSWLVVGYLLLFDVLVLAPGGRFRSAFARLWREAWIWLGYGVLTILAMVNYFTFYYAPLKPRATIAELLRYVGIQFTQEFAPSATGLRPLTTGWTNTAALVLDSALLVVIVAVSLYRRPRAWRVWTVFVIGFLANSVMIGANRVGYFGVGFGQQLYYLQSPAYLFLLCAGVAFSLDPAGVPYGVRHDASVRSRVPAHARRPPPRAPIWRASACLLAVGLYAVVFVISATQMNAKDESNLASATARSYFTTMLGQMDAVSRDGLQAAVLNTTVPDGIVASSFAPWNQLALTLPVVRADAHIDQLRQETFEVSSDGSLVPLRFVRASGTPAGLPLAAVTPGPGATPTGVRPAGSGGQCFTTARAGATVDVRLVTPYNTGAAWLLVALASPSGGPVNVSTFSNGVPAPLAWTDLPPGNTPVNYLLPLSPRTFDHVQLAAGKADEDLCVSSIDVGTFSRN